MKLGEGTIDWNTATVQDHTLTVGVRFSGPPSPAWARYFDELATLHNQSTLKADKWGSVEGKPGYTVVVEDVTPGCEVELRTQIDHLAKLASDKAVESEKKTAEVMAKNQRKLEQREDNAEEMQRKFRDAA